MKLHSSYKQFALALHAIISIIWNIYITIMTHHVTSKLANNLHELHWKWPTTTKHAFKLEIILFQNNKNQTNKINIMWEFAQSHLKLFARSINKIVSKQQKLDKWNEHHLEIWVIKIAKFDIVGNQLMSIVDSVAKCFS